MYNPDFLQHRLLYRDGLLLIIDKPAGLPVHAGPSGRDHLGFYLDALRFGLPKAPELGHRLDTDTSGVLVLGRHAKALRKLGRVFSDNLAQKTYWAIVAGGPQQDQGVIDLPLHKVSSRAKGWRMVVDHQQGKASTTAWSVLGRSAKDNQGQGWSWLELRPKTGRTHQLRLHCAAMGFPILGDPMYGVADCLDSAKDLKMFSQAQSQDGGAQHIPRLQLHARALTFPFQQNKPPIDVCAPVPEDMIASLTACGWPGQDSAFYL